jgi:hypothetical protein
MSEKHVDKSPDEMGPEELRRAAGHAVQQWGVLLAARLSVDDSWRLLLAGAISVMQAELTSQQIADTLRQAADRVDSGELESTSH